MTSEIKERNRNKGLEFLLNWILFFIISMGSIYITLKALAIFYPNGKELAELSMEFEIIGRDIFNFLRPLILIIVFLLIVDWILEKIGVSFKDIAQYVKKKNQVKEN